MQMIYRPSRRTSTVVAWLAGLCFFTAMAAHPLRAQGSGAADAFYDSHFHLTNYIQQGITVREFLQIMGTRVGRSRLFGIPLQQQWSHANSGNLVEAMLADPSLAHVHFDISWDEVAKYAVSSPESVACVATMLNKYPDRFLFGTDTVAPASAAAYYNVFEMWDPVWRQLTPEARKCE
jgi:hypothetical protein